jgi:hypothetical protein
MLAKFTNLWRITNKPWEIFLTNWDYNLHMSDWNRLFKDHPASVGETYGQHFTAAMGFGFRMIWGGIVCMVHAIVPGAFATAGSDVICELHERMVTNRRRKAEARSLALESRRAA